jgi:hypothetical protein
MNFLQTPQRWVRRTGWKPVPLLMSLACLGCLPKATSTTVLLGVTVKVTFVGAGSVATAAPQATPLPGDLPPDEETIQFAIGTQKQHVTIRTAKPEDFKGPRLLLVNTVEYGTVNEGDTVEVENETVKVNGVLRPPLK